MEQVRQFNTAKKEWGHGVDYREIAKKLTKSSEPISFTGVRSIFLKAMQKFAMEYIRVYRPEIMGLTKKAFAEELANSTEFQNAVGGHLHKIIFGTKI